MVINRNVNAKGDLGIKVIRAPGPGLWWKIKNYCRLSFILSWLGVFVVAPVVRMCGIATAHGTLSARLIRADGKVINYGILGFKSLTTAFVDFFTDQLQTETSVFGDFKYHDSGIGTTAENISNTDMETTDGASQATGTQTENAHNIYESVGTISYTGTYAITEHGLFNASTGVTLMDRTVFSAVNVASGDSIQFTYRLIFSAGG